RWSERAGRTSCWIDTPNCQSQGRTPQPSRIAGLIVVVTMAVFPKFRLFHCPQSSPPVARLFCRSWFMRSQSGTLLPLPSVHGRDVLVTNRARAAESFAGLFMV